MGVRGGQLPPQFGQFVDINSGKESTLFGQNTIHVCFTPRSLLRYVSGGVTNETFIGYYSTTVIIIFFSLAGPRDKQFAFAIRAKLGLTPQMDVGPYGKRDEWLPT